ncbi:transposase, Mutator family protein [Bacillus pseudomycoides]|nr:transposase, Mutator family protein [Bacillus pseudomycoides]
MTNLIESFNKQIKKYTKRKEQFPNEESMERFLVSQFEDYNQLFEQSYFLLRVTFYLKRAKSHLHKNIDAPRALTNLF